jgi:hypothetical protein
MENYSFAWIVLQLPNDGASAAAHLRPTFILADNAKTHFQIRTRRLGGQLQARVGPVSEICVE